MIGWSYDSVENVFEIVNIADLGIGLGGVISSHCGPGTLGVLFIAK